MGNVLHHRGVAHNGARHQLWKEGHIQRYIQRIFLCGRIAPVNVDHIAESLEGEK